MTQTLRKTKEFPLKEFQDQEKGLLHSLLSSNTGLSLQRAH